VSIGDRVSNSWQREGLSGLVFRTAVYLLRRIAWNTDAWSKKLDASANRRSLLKENAELLRRNEAFRGLHARRRCFVIGNGPSLKQQDLSRLADEITFVTNSFHLHPAVGPHWQPTYYCLSDPGYFQGPESVPELKEIADRVTTSLFFVPHHARRFLEETRALPEDRTYYVAFNEELSSENVGKFDLTTTTPGVQTVVQLAILIAMFMQCSPIYLLGMDHDWLAHGGKHLNFYSNENPEDQPAGNLPGWGYHAMMDAVTIMWRVYELQSLMAREAGVEIINVTRGGFLDVFPRADYEKVIEDKMVASF